MFFVCVRSLLVCVEFVCVCSPYVCEQHLCEYFLGVCSPGVYVALVRKVLICVCIFRAIHPNMGGNELTQRGVCCHVAPTEEDREVKGREGELVKRCALCVRERARVPCACVCVIERREREREREREQNWNKARPESQKNIDA